MEVAEFIKKLCVCDMYVIPTEDIIFCESLVQKAVCEFLYLVYLKQWETATSKEKSQDCPLLPKAYTV